MKKILGLGNVLVDISARISHDDVLAEMQLPKGSMQLIDADAYEAVSRKLAAYETQRTTGGSACNTILAIAHLGGSCALVGRIGRDENGRFFSDSFSSWGVQCHFGNAQCTMHNAQSATPHSSFPTPHSSLPTGVAFTFISPDAQRTFATYLGAAAALSAHDLQPEMFHDVDYVYIEGYLVASEALVRRAIDLAHAAGAKVCLDLASYNIVQAYHDFFPALLPHVDILFANEEEARALTGCEAEEALRKMRETCPEVVVKIGKHGAIASAVKDGFVHVPAREVPVVVDTTAAGDYFSAGFLFARAAGRNLQEAVEAGSLLAGHIIEVVGTALPEATWVSLRKQIKTNSPQTP